MERIAPYIGLLLALILGGIALILPTGSVSVVRTPSAASSSLSVLPSVELAPPTLPDLTPKIAIPSTTSATSSRSGTAKKVVPIAPKVALVTPPPAPAVTPTPVSDDAGLIAAASALRAALVNIICYAPSGSGVNSISGSGVFIDPKGVILTNAHVAQYFLLADRGVSCVIRSGSPATDRYKASAIFISPAWINANASVLSQANPIGTGEYDFALIAITKSATSDALPSAFPYLPLGATPPSALTPIVIGSYGAQFLDSFQIRSALFPILVYGSVKDVYTFNTHTIDVLALGGSAAAQEGSSGGGVVNAKGALVGTITTSTVEGDTNTRQLDAISASYIRADYASETGTALDILLDKPVSAAVSDFAPKATELEAVLTAQLH